MARSFRPLDVYYWRRQCERGVKNYIVSQVHLNNLNAPYIRRYSEEWYIEITSLRYKMLLLAIESSMSTWVRVHKYEYLSTSTLHVDIESNFKIILCLLCVKLRQTGHSSTIKFSWIIYLISAHLARSNAVACSRMQSNALECGRMQSNALECGRMQSNAAQCSRVHLSAPAHASPWTTANLVAAPWEAANSNAAAWKTAN